MHDPGGRSCGKPQRRSRWLNGKLTTHAMSVRGTCRANQVWERQADASTCRTNVRWACWCSGVKNSAFRAVQHVPGIIAEAVHDLTVDLLRTSHNAWIALSRIVHTVEPSNSVCGDRGGRREWQGNPTPISAPFVLRFQRRHDRFSGANPRWRWPWRSHDFGSGRSRSAFARFPSARSPLAHRPSARSTVGRWNDYELRRRAK